jgi:transcriptional antiterminator RfaH
MRFKVRQLCLIYRLFAANVFPRFIKLRLQTQRSERASKMLSANGDTLSWYVVHTHPKQEERTNHNLSTWGIETLTPRLQVNKVNEFTGKVTHIARPLFPGYIFSRFKYNDVFHRVRYTRGVHSLVSFNNTPAVLDDEIVELMRMQIGKDGFVKTLDQLEPGDEVIINNGRFQNFRGVFESGISDSDRVRILLDTVSFQAHIVVDRAAVKKVSSVKRAPAPSRFAYSS